MDMDWLFTSPSFGVTLWNCRHGQRALSDERIQHWHVVSFIYESAFVLHSEGRAEHVDQTAAMLYNPRQPYRSSHPYGCGDHGSALVVRSDVLLDVMSRYDPAAVERPANLFPAILGRGLSRAYLLHRTLVHALTSGMPHDPADVEATLLDIVGDVAT